VQDQVPVSIVGGFLGAGKTTLLNQVLTKSHGVRFAVIVNDFGSIAIDDRLVRSHDGETISFANGCICCSLGDSLVTTIDRVLESDQRPEHFLVETSGVSDPRAIADIATLHPDLRRDLIIVLADASNFDARARDPRLKETIETQLNCADLIVLNKCDLAEKPAAIAARLTQQSSARAIQTTHADFPLEALSTARLSATDFTTPVIRTKLPAHKPESVFQTVSVNLPHPLPESRLRQALDDAELLRAKGFLHIVERPGLTHVERAGSRTSMEPWSLEQSPIALEPALVVIGLNGVMKVEAITRLANYA